MNRKIAVCCGNPKVGCAERNDDCPHFGVNIAEDVGNAIAIKADRPVRMSFVETEVKALSIKERKDVVVEGVKVGKVYAAAGRYDENMRGELLIFLLKRVALGRARRRDVLASRMGVSQTTTSPDVRCAEWLAPRLLVSLT